MTRICKYSDCHEPVSSPRAEFCKPAHRAAFWRTRHVTAGPVDHPRAGANARSGSQISYRKAVDVLTGWLWMSSDLDRTRDDAHREADLILRGALPEKQAERERQRAQS